MFKIFDAASTVKIQASKHYDSVINSTGHRNDEGKSLYTTNQLMYLETKVQTKLEKDLTGLVAFITDNTGDPGATSIGVNTEEATGTAKQIGNSGKDFPQVEIGGEQDIFPAINYGLEYQTNIEELANARYAGVNVDSKKADRVSRGMDEGPNKCIWKGDGKLPGVFDTKTIKTLTYEPLAKKIRNMTAEEFEADIVVKIGIANANYGGDVDTLLLCSLDYTYVISRKSFNAESMLIADYLRKIGIKNIIKCPELDGIFDGGTKDGMILMPRSADVAVARFLGGRKRALPAFFDGWNFTTKYLSKFSGLHVYLPKKILWSKA